MLNCIIQHVYVNIAKGYGWFMWLPPAALLSIGSSNCSAAKCTLRGNALLAQACGLSGGNKGGYIQ